MRIDRIKRAALRRKYHVRKKVFGTPNRPRLSVFRSNRHIYAQIIDDAAGATLALIEIAISFMAELRLLLKRQERLGCFFKKATEFGGKIGSRTG